MMTRDHRISNDLVSDLAEVGICYSEDVSIYDIIDALRQSYHIHVRVEPYYPSEGGTSYTGVIVTGSDIKGDITTKYFHASSHNYYISLNHALKEAFKLIP